MGFLGCFEFASVNNHNKEARPDSRAGPSGVRSVNTVTVRKGLSNEMTIQLGELLINEACCLFVFKRITKDSKIRTKEVGAEFKQERQVGASRFVVRRVVEGG